MDQDRPSQFDVELACTPAPEPQCSIEENLLESLEGFWGPCPNRKRAMLEIASALDAGGDQRAGEALRRIFARLRGRHGRLLRVALVGASNMSEEARSMGMARQNLEKSVQRIRARIFTSPADAP